MPPIDCIYWADELKLTLVKMDVETKTLSEGRQERTVVVKEFHYQASWKLYSKDTVWMLWSHLPQLGDVSPKLLGIFKTWDQVKQKIGETCFDPSHEFHLIQYHPENELPTGS